MAKFFEYIELRYDKLNTQINNWLSAVYNKSGVNFNTASPYGQILTVLKEIFQHTIIYLKNAINVLNIETTQDKKAVQQTARISGHSVGRAISATGTLRFTLKVGVDTSKEIKDSLVVFENNMVLSNKTNSLKYTSNTNIDKNMFPISPSITSFVIPIVQGIFETQSYTGNGRINQTYAVNIQGDKQVENFNVSIKYNGRVLLLKDHIYDMLPREFSCVVKSGFNGGIDIQFGNERFGFIPTNGSIIDVKYLISDGAAGEVLNPVSNNWKIDSEVRDGQGNSLDVNKLFNIAIESDINFASDGENIEFTKMAIPYVSRNFVLGTPNQFIYHLKKLNMFSKVNAYNKLDDNNFSINDTVIENAIKQINTAINQNKSKDEVNIKLNNFNKLYSQYKNNTNDNEIYLYLIPDIKKYFNQDTNYFNIPFDAFYLDQNEQNKIITYLKSMGTLSLTTEIKIVQPIISKYIVHVYIRRYDNVSEDNIEQEVIANISDYLLNNSRIDRIPKSDFVSLIKGIEGVDSASVYFISEKNENYHRDKKNGYDVNKILGIDIVHGDIICELNEYVVVRGGWRDKDGIWYNDGVANDSLGSINVTFDSVTYKK